MLILFRPVFARSDEEESVNTQGDVSGFERSKPGDLERVCGGALLLEDLHLVFAKADKSGGGRFGLNPKGYTKRGWLVRRSAGQVPRLRKRNQCTSPADLLIIL